MLAYICGISRSCYTLREVDDFGNVDPPGVDGLPVVFVQLSPQAALPVVVLALDSLRLGLLLLQRCGSGLELPPLLSLVVRIPQCVVLVASALVAYAPLTACRRQ